MTSRKLAIFTPLPPTKSGIADYAVELGRALERQWDITFVIADDAEDPVGVDYAPVMRLADWKSAGTDDVPRFYQLGNNIHHAYIYRELISHPGVTLMHDFSMHHLLVEMTLAKSDTQSYVTLMSAEYGEAGEHLSRSRCEHYIHHRMVEFLFPLNQQVIINSKGVVLHSYSSLNELHYRFPDKMAIRVPFPYEEPEPGLLMGGRDKARELLGIDSNKLIYASFGFVTPPKQIELTLKAFARCKDEIPDFEYILVGEVSPAVPVDKLIEELGLQGRVRVTGFVDFATFHHYIEACDISVALRYPSAGETSAALMRAMGMGRANIVFDYASYADYPDETVYKLPLDTYDPSSLVDAISKLGKDVGYRHALGNNAAEYLRTEHDIDNVASMMTAFITDCYRY